MLIGIDLDNTIACYDEGFLTLAREMGLVPRDFRGSKKAVRDSIRSGPGGDVVWQELQAILYGREIGRARLADGVDRLLTRAKARGIPVVIVSHKTQFSPFDTATDLRVTAKAWMESNGLFDPDGMAVRPDRVFFESTRQDKIRRIETLGCTHFIDDLDEVFGEPVFPTNVRSYLYAAGYDRVPSGRFQAFRTHDEIADHLLGVDPAAATLALAGSPAERITPILRSGNNRLYRIEGRTGVMALKSYPSPDDDKRDRLGTEFSALSFLNAQGEKSVPAPIAFGRSMNVALYQWIDGQPIGSPIADDIDAALAFVARLKDYGRAEGAPSLPLASEACLSIAELLRQLIAREKKLSEIAARDTRLNDLLTRVSGHRDRWAEGAGSYQDTELPPEKRTLSPSDFGFHNALRNNKGEVVFLDFEYFGWDDPVKLTADFLLHPGMTLDASARRRFARGMTRLYAGDPDFPARLGRQLPLYVLRWCLILLNEFLPERWARRAISGGRDLASIKERQLTKAEALLEQVATVHEYIA